MFLEHADAAEQEAGMQNVHIVIVSLIKEHFAMCTSHLLQQADANRCKTPTCCICPGGSGTSQGTSSQVCTDLGIEERLLQSRQDGWKHFENMAYGRMTSKVSKVLMSFPNLRDRSFGPLGRLVWETSDDWSSTCQWHGLHSAYATRFAELSWRHVKTCRDAFWINLILLSLPLTVHFMPLKLSEGSKVRSMWKTRWSRGNGEETDLLRRKTCTDLSISAQQ